MLIWLRGNANLRALIDSGADISIFHSSLAPVLGIELTSGLRQQFIGIAGRLDGYLHEVTLKVIGLDEATKMAVAFGELEGVSAILGQTDFFQQYRITFERYNELIEIDPA